MLSSQIPTKFPIPWANNAGGSYIRNIPVSSQIGIQNGAASLTDGFPPVTFTPIAAGGVPPFGQDFNGILKQITQWTQWYSAGGAIQYDLAFAIAIGGYPARSVVMSNTVPGNLFMSLIDNNLTDPDSDTSSGWTIAPNTLGTGAWTWRASDEILEGWVKANMTTIGSPTSNASQRSNSDCYPLYKWHWDRFANNVCPVFTNAGAPTTRGASATADFSAGKAIQILDIRGTGISGMDTMGGPSSSRLQGVPPVYGNAITPGSVLGENLHVLIADENGPHFHPISIGAMTGTESTTHYHAVNGETGFQSNSHRHNYDTAPNKDAFAQGGGTFGAWSGLQTEVTTYADQDHKHAVNLTSGGQSVLHTHNVNVVGNSVSSGLGAAHNTFERNMVGTMYLHL